MKLSDDVFLEGKLMVVRLSNGSLRILANSKTSVIMEVTGPRGGSYAYFHVPRESMAHIQHFLSDW